MKFSNKLANVIEYMKVSFYNKKFNIKIFKHKKALDTLLYVLEIIKGFEIELNSDL
jgi:hypothetical protein